MPQGNVIKLFRNYINIAASKLSNSTTPFSNAISFDGVDDYMEMSVQNGLNQPLSRDVSNIVPSASVTANHTATSGEPWAANAIFRTVSSSEDRYIFCQSSGTTGSDPNASLLVKPDGTLQFYYGDTTNSLVWNSGLADKINDDVWYAVYVDYNGGAVTNNTTRFRIRVVDIFNGTVSEPSGTWTMNGVDQGYTGSLDGGNFYVGGKGVATSVTREPSSGYVYNSSSPDRREWETNISLNTYQIFWSTGNNDTVVASGTQSSNSVTAGGWTYHRGTEQASEFNSITGWTTNSYEIYREQINLGSVTYKFKGDIASVVTTTLRCNQELPDDKEIAMMTLDPYRWETLYKDEGSYLNRNGTFRKVNETTDTNGFHGHPNYTNTTSADWGYATQIYLMGDGASDAYNIIHNNARGNHADNTTNLNMVNMDAGDIVPITIQYFTPIAGTTPLINDTTLDDGSAVTLNSPLDDGYRMIFNQQWVETNVLPNLNNAGDTVFLGVPSASANFAAGVTESDFDTVIKWEYTNSHLSTIKDVINSNENTQTVSGTNDAFYDYAFELDGNNLNVIASTTGIEVQPALNDNGQFTRGITNNNYTNIGQVDIVYAVVNTTATYGNNGVSDQEIPTSVQPDVGTLLSGFMLDGDTMQDGTFIDTNLTLSQGQRLVVEASVGFTAESWNHGFIPNKYVVGVLKATVTEPYDFSDFDYAVVYESQDLSTDLHMTSVYQGLTRVAEMSQISQAGGDGAIEISDDGTEIAFIADLQPAGSGQTVISSHRLSNFHDVHFADGINYGATPRTIAIAVIGRDGDLPLSGSSFSGISTITNPAISINGLTHKSTSTDYSFTGGMQVGTWVAFNQTLDAGRRIVFDSDFIQDLFDNMNIGDYIYIGVEDTTFNGATGISNFRRDNYTAIYKQSATELSFQGFSNNSQLFTQIVNQSNLNTNYAFSIELTFSGNNIRNLYDFNHGQDITTVTYADWTATKLQTGNQGYGLTSVNIIMYYTNSGSNTLDLRPFNIVNDVIEYYLKVAGTTLEGPSINQTGNNLFNDPVDDSDGVVWGWLSFDDQLSAGQRLVLDNAFLIDLTNAMPDNSGIFIGLKSSSWTNNYRNNSIANATYAGARFEIYKYSSSDIRVNGRITGASSIGINVGTNGILINGVELAFEIDSSGNNINLMLGTNSNSSDDVNTTAYADWSSSHKTETGNQGFGITSLDIMLLGDGNLSILTSASGAMDTEDVDWTGTTIINAPSAAPTNLTSWTKALDFSGGNEHTFQANSSYLYAPLKMNNVGATVAAPSAGNTVSSGHPWATAIVFNPDIDSSNQHVWNVGEGSASTDDNIYLRLSATGQLYFGWGRSGALNECFLGNISTSWYGLYIGFNGTRLSGSNATSNNLANCFDIRFITLSSGTAQLNRSTASNWTSTGGRMDRQFAGSVTLGGRGSNRNFHGKIASMIMTTLRCGVAMPSTTEIETMVTDPVKWVTDYKIGNAYRRATVTTDTSNFQLNSLDTNSATQVWLMGDGVNDSITNGIRNYIYPTETNRTRMIMSGMVASDIETVSISGLS